MSVYIMSDPHYSHRNIVRGVSEWEDKNTRDFKTVEEHDSTIVENINSTVGEGDTLICLGDWNFGGLSKLKEFRERVRCKSVGLICGNHDNKHNAEWNPVIPTTGKRAADYFSFYLKYDEFAYNGEYLVLFHYPIYSWNGMSGGSIHLFGHVHSPPEMKYFNGGRSLDVGLDGNNLMPYNLDEVVDDLRKRPVKREGHH